ncbi:hypothetical protein JG688_00018199 [Phytophthora aleatoria]|uniref:Transposase n=1 Tax=Phytophthora aleatoria TaxID=2496075 RepID=A0A8J5LY35_9STRA|nr:hypothetical protein JG688_00018199 [Phytophthora aleatoria]
MSNWLIAVYSILILQFEQSRPTCDFRWRAVFLTHVYGISVGNVSYIFGPKVRTLLRWYSLFLSSGVVDEKKERVKTSRWPSEVVSRVKLYVKENPTFYLEELQEFLSDTFPDLANISTSTICRALNFDMNLSRKVLTKAARECVPKEVEVYKSKLQAIYSYPEQLLFIAETSKDGRHAYRRYAWSRRNRKAVVRLPFSRGERRSILAALDHQGLVAWTSTPGTFTRNTFHRAFIPKIVPLLNPWPYAFFPFDSVVLISLLLLGMLICLGLIRLCIKLALGYCSYRATHLTSIQSRFVLGS